MCDCRNEIEAKLLTRFKEQSPPEAREHTAKLQGYAFIFGSEVQEKGYMPIWFTGKFPLKKGGEKPKVMKQNMIFTFCPFCGEKYP